LKRDTSKRYLLNVIKIAVGLFLLYLSFNSIDWEVLWTALQSISVTWLGMGLFSVFLGLGLKLWRWDTLLRNYNLHCSPFRLITAFFLGQAANILLVFRGGEVVRLATTHQPGEDDWVEITATIAIEKYLDLLLLIVMMIVMATNLPDIALTKLGQLYPVVLAFSITLLLLVIFGPFLWHKIFSKESKFLWMRKKQQKIDQFIQTSLWLRNPRNLGFSVVQSAFIWVVMACTNWLLFKALNINLGCDAAILVLILVYIGVLPALMPGNLGPFTYFAQLALIPYAVSQDVAVAFAIILYALVNLPPLLVSGLLLLLPKSNQLKVSNE